MYLGLVCERVRGKRGEGERSEGGRKERRGRERKEGKEMSNSWFF